LEILARGRATWDRWREEHPGTVPDLGRADLSGADLRGFRLGAVNLAEANLERANLARADLFRSNLLRANLSDALLAGADLGAAILGRANLSRAVMWMANLAGANLVQADLTDADLGKARLSSTEMAGASMRGARLHDTVLSDLDLSRTEHLISCRHEGPSAIDHRTLDRSGTLPLSFLRGCGLPEPFIESLSTIVDPHRAYDPCFIRSDPHDLAFAQRLWADLQHEGVRCWCGPEGGAGDEVARQASRHRARMILILSERALCSDWIVAELRRIVEEERRRHRTALVPIRIDDAIADSPHSWVARIRSDRTVRDFSEWRDRISYQGALGRLLGDLRSRRQGRTHGGVTRLPSARARLVEKRSA